MPAAARLAETTMRAAARAKMVMMAPPIEEPGQAIRQAFPVGESNKQPAAKKLCPFDLRLHTDECLRRVDIDQRRLAGDRHFDHGLAIAADEVAGADIAFDRHQIGEEA